jgi:hypothetical protein
MAKLVVARPTEGRFLASRESGQVHDLEKEVSDCSIDQIVERMQAVVLLPDTNEQAGLEGYMCCSHCIVRESG